MIWLFHKVSPAHKMPPPAINRSGGLKYLIKRFFRDNFGEFLGYEFRLPSQWWVTQEFFRQKMEDAGNYEVVSLRDYTDHKSQLVITFDGVYENVYCYAFPILREFGYPFELFVTGKFVGRTNDFDGKEPLVNFADQDQLREMENNGGILEYHSYSHADLTILDALQMENEIRPIFECEFFAYPYGRFNAQVIDMVRGYYKGALSVNHGNDQRYQMLREETCHQKIFLL